MRVKAMVDRMKETTRMRREKRTKVEGQWKKEDLLTRSRLRVMCASIWEQSQRPELKL